MDKELEALRARALELLHDEARAMRSGDMAVLLEVPTYRLHLALHGAIATKEVHFGKDGWSLPPPDTRPTFDDSQPRIL